MKKRGINESVTTGKETRVLITEDNETLWTTKKGLIERYEYLNMSTLSHWLMEMRASKEFREFVINPSPKLVWINLEGFHQFLLFKQRNNYR